MLRTAVLVALLAMGLPGVGAADLYQWVDDSGRVHMTDDLSQVPAKQRAGSRVPVDENQTAESSRWNHVNVRSDAHRAVASVHRVSPGQEKGRVHVLRIKRAGRSIQVTALINGHVPVPYIVDTGASINTIPRSAVHRLGIRIDESTPSTIVAGIGGRAMKVPVVTLRSVQIGTAVVENVEMAVLDTMREGLLGMPYFNNFRVSLDPTKGTLELEEVDLNAIEGIYGGLDESTWRTKFRLIRAQLEHIAERIRITPDESYIMLGELEKREGYWKEQRRQLERKATRAGVPRAWRE